MKNKKLINEILTLFFPKRCAGCDCIIMGNHGVCSACKTKIRLLDGDTCMICGKKVKDGTVYCYDCNRKNHVFIQNIAVFVYSDIRESLYRFKYHGRAEYAAYYARMANEVHGKKIASWKADAIIPIPLHESRYRKRGYNQAQEFANELSVRTGVPVNGELLKRVKNTKPLKLLSASERQNNLKKAFLFKQNDVKLNTIILVDDIYTTGATLDAAAMACREGGVNRIYTITVAVGRGF